MPKRPSRRSLRSAAQDTQAVDTPLLQLPAFEASPASTTSSESSSTRSRSNERNRDEPQHEEQSTQPPSPPLRLASDEIERSTDLDRSASKEDHSTQEALPELSHPNQASGTLSNDEWSFSVRPSSSSSSPFIGNNSTQHSITASASYPAAPTQTAQPFRRIASGFEAEAAPGLGDRTRLLGVVVPGFGPDGRYSRSRSPAHYQPQFDAHLPQQSALTCRNRVVVVVTKARLLTRTTSLQTLKEVLAEYSVQQRRSSIPLQRDKRGNK